MILLNPGISNDVSVFVRNSQTSYDATLTDQSTKKADTFTFPFTVTNSFEGEVSFNIPLKVKKNTFYTLILRSGGKVENYSVCFCGTNLSQRFSRKSDMFVQPTKYKPLYKLPDKS